MANKNLNQFTSIDTLNINDELLIWDLSSATTRKTTLGELGSSGIIGVSGTSGTSGISDGSSGVSGSSGSSGSSGTSGTRGTSGSSGGVGTSGTSGSSGSSGSSGTSGTSGSTGAAGSSGSSGVAVGLTSGTREGIGTNAGLGSSGNPALYAQLTFSVTSLVTDSLAAGTYLIGVIFEISIDSYDCYFKLYKNDGTALGVERRKQLMVGKEWISWAETVTLASTATIQVWAKTDDLVYGNQFAYGGGSSICWVKLA